MKFNKRWKAKLYINWLKIKNRIKYTNITFESYGIEHQLPSDSYSIIELILSTEMENAFKKELLIEIDKINYRTPTEAKWMQDWINQIAKSKLLNKEKNDYWIEIEGIGKFKNLMVISDEQFNTDTLNKVTINLDYDDWIN